MLRPQLSIAIRHFLHSKTFTSGSRRSRSSSKTQKIKIRQSIGKELEKDKQELERQLAELSNLQDKEQFLVKERRIQIKDSKIF
jgi:hypothetical protein